MKARAQKNSLLSLTKLSGAGNTFLLVDWRSGTIRKNFKRKFKGLSRSRAAALLCDPYQSIGADGLLFLEHPSKSESAHANLKWDFYNADGSRAEMCGNAARVVGLYENKFATKLLTRAGLIRISQNGSGRGAEFEVEMPEINAFEPDQRVKTGSGWLGFDYVNSGVPHAVIYIERAKNLKQLLRSVDKLVETVNSIRSLTRFKPAGTNVTFYVTKDGKPPMRTGNASIESLTYERGVAGYTQACGTGVVAAAYSLSHKRLKKTKSVLVKTPGGRLQVLLDSKRPFLIGPAVKIAEIMLP